MKTIKLISIILSFLWINAMFSQTKEEIQEIQSHTNMTVLKQLENQFSEEFKQKKEEALRLAQQKGWDIIVRNDKGDIIRELIEVSPKGEPIYLSIENVDAANSSRANHLNTGGSLGLNLNGQSMAAHVWDAGKALFTHQEYGSRVTAGDAGTTTHYHAGHVIGTIAAAGVVPAAKGMANQSNVLSYDWNNDLSEATTAASSGMLLSNHSYGYHPVFIPDWWFGAYTSVSRSWDELMYNSPYYLMVKAAGNDGNNDTYNALPLNGNSAYDKLGPRATAKNSLVIAAANDANIDSNGNLVSVSIASFSSEGPTDDLRIKPDLAGNGVGLYSTYVSSNTAYNSISGTSMATPNITGTLLLLQQHYANLNSNFMRAATLKGLALHTADDFGSTGPDVITGWGLMNAKFAAETISNAGGSSIIEENSLNNGNSYSFNVTSDGINPLMVSLSWTDPAGTANTGTANDPTPVLVNDLDIRVTQGASTYFPYKLTSITTNATADNSVDPYERIDINGASGNYTITVTHKGALSSGSQNYSLIVTGLQTISPCPANLNITANVLSGGIDHQEADVSITASNTVSSGAEAVYHAGDEVLLTSDFDALNGSVFRAYIEGCTGNFQKNLPNTNEREIIRYPIEEIQQSVEESNESFSIRTSPNPNKGIFKVYLEAIPKGELQVVDMFGNIILTKAFNNTKELEVDISNQRKGIYNVRVISNQQVITEKVIYK